MNPWGGLGKVHGRIIPRGDGSGAADNAAVQGKKKIFKDTGKDGRRGFDTGIGDLRPDERHPPMITANAKALRHGLPGRFLRGEKSVIKGHAAKNNRKAGEKCKKVSVRAIKRQTGF